MYRNKVVRGRERTERGGEWGCAGALHGAVVPLQLADVPVLVLLARHHFVVVVGGVVVVGVGVGARLAVRAVRARVRAARRLDVKA